MKQFFANNWKLITIVVVTAVVIGIVFWLGKKYGVNTTAPDIPGDNPADPLTDAEKAKALSIAERINADINDWDGGAFRDWPPYNELASASDKVFVAVYNLYKQKYDVSLRTDMQGESYWIDQAPLVNNTDPIQLILDRFNKLNLS